MSAVQDFYQLTIEMITWLKDNQHTDRDSKIQHVEELLEKRDAFMENIKPPFTSDEQQLGKQLVELNKQLDELLQKEKSAIQKDLKSLQIKKESTNKYVNPYQSLATDGIFYDQRK